MKKNSIELRALLWKLYNNNNARLLLPENGRVYFEIKNNLSDGYLKAIGYIKINKLAIRVDILERIFFCCKN